MVQHVQEVKRLTAGVHFSSNEVRIGKTAKGEGTAQKEEESGAAKKGRKKVDEQRERIKKSMEVRALNRPKDQ